MILRHRPRLHLHLVLFFKNCFQTLKAATTVSGFQNGEEKFYNMADNKSGFICTVIY